MQAGFFLAPIIYPLGILPERFHFYLYLVAADAGHRVLARGAGRRRACRRLARTSYLALMTPAILAVGRR